MKIRISLLVFLVPIAMLVIALGNMPWGYYQILRLVVAAASTWIATVMFASGKHGPGGLFVVLALAYNPFIPLRLGREAWEVVNIATIIILLVGLAICRSLAPPPARL
jgi:hypothetical protein